MEDKWDLSFKRCSWLIWEVLVPLQTVFWNALHNEQTVFKKKKWALQRRYFRHTEEMMKVDMLRSCDMG